jgi:hypothetical protein
MMHPAESHQQKVPTGCPDSAENLSKRWPGLRSAKEAWRFVWAQLGARPGPLRVHVADVGDAVGALDQSRSGKRLLEALEKQKLIQDVKRDGGWWAFYVVHPREARDGLRRIDPDPQGELFEERQEPAVKVAVPPGEYLEVGEEHQPNTIPIPTGGTATFTADSLLSDPAYMHTLDGLVHLWILTSKAHVGRGRKRDEEKAIRPQVQATLDAGFQAEAIVVAIRERANTLEWYSECHKRLLQAKKGNNGRSKATSHGDYDPNRTDYPSAGKDVG